MAAIATPLVSSSPVAGAPDQRVVLHGVDWKTYVAVRELIDSPGVRMTYREGVLEIMSPVRPHEEMKKKLARLLELFGLERGVRVYGYGSTTFRRQEKERGLEPDECYCFGQPMKEYPDLAIEVVHTSGGIDKLDVYAGLGVREVWFWKQGLITVHLLRNGDYVEVPRSEVLPQIDLRVLAEHAALEDQHESVLAYRTALRGES